MITNAVLAQLIAALRRKDAFLVLRNFCKIYALLFSDLDVSLFSTLDEEFVVMIW